MWVVSISIPSFDIRSLSLAEDILGLFIPKSAFDQQYSSSESLEQALFDANVTKWGVPSLLYSVNPATNASIKYIDKSINFKKMKTQRHIDSCQLK